MNYPWQVSSERIYRTLVLMYPRTFREDYGAAMFALFRDCCRVAYRERGMHGVIAEWASSLWDIAVSVPREWLSVGTQVRRTTMVPGMVSLVVPAYNEEGTIEAVVRGALGELPALFARFEVVVVNDGSTDGTAGVADELAAAHPEQVRVIHHPANRGRHKALQAGLQAARGDHLLFANDNRPFGVGFGSA